MPHCRYIGGLTALATLFVTSALWCQPAPEPLTLSRAVALAIERYPSIRVSEEQLAAARSAIDLARTAYLPRLDTYAQINRATHNNVFGILLPQSVIPPISGPVTPASLSSVWGSATGVLASWEPLDFGLRRANVAAGQAGHFRAEAAVRRTKFEVASLTAETYLTLTAAEQMVRSAAAGVERMRTIENMIGAVVRAELRPGADLSRTQAERALAETQVAQSRMAAAVARATLAELTALQPGEIIITPGKLLDSPPGMPAEPDLTQHPRQVEQQAAIDEVKARQLALDRSWVPRFQVQAAAFVRGTGARTDGTSGEAYSGLGPNTGNWALGFSVTFPLFDLPALKIRRQMESHSERAESARLNQISTELRGERNRAAARLEGARQLATLTPVQLKSTRENQQQATARYQAGLGTAIEVADALRLLTQSEIDDALAKLGVWRAMLAVAAASGNLDPFLEQTR